MSYLLTDPTAVLVAGDGPLAADARSALEPAPVDVRTAADVAAATDAVAASDDVGCVVAIDDLADVRFACERLRDVDERRPVLAYLDAPDAEAIAAITRAGAGAVVLASDPDATLRDSATIAVERFETRRERAAESGLFRSLLDGIEGSLYAKDDHGRHLRKSTTPGDVRPENARGKTDPEIYGDCEAARESHADDLRVAETGEPIYGKEESFTAPDGRHWTRTTKLPWTEDGEVVGLVGLTRDVTDEVHWRRRLERFDDRMRRFARSVRHDVRNPLQVASGTVEYAMAHESTDELDRAADALDRIDEILDDLVEREVAEMASHETDDDAPPALPLRAVVEDVWSVAGARSARLDVRVRDGAVVNEPPSAVRPVLENLMKNAVDHGGDDVTVRVGASDAGGLYVADDGPGVPPDERESVFEDGFTTAEDGTGTGLGIVAEVADHRSWDLSVTDSWADGARVDIGNLLLVPDQCDATPAGDPVSLTSGDDVGAVDAAGRSDYDAAVDRWTVAGAGRNVFADTNEFHFRSAAVDGPVRIEGRVIGLSAEGEWSMAGLMIRSDRTPSATYGCIGRSGGHGTGLLWRTEQGAPGESRHLEDDADGLWYRVDRAGDVVTAYRSPDGERWRAVDQRRVALGESAHVGLAVCSVEAGTLATGTFEGVTVRRLDIAGGEDDR